MVKATENPVVEEVKSEEKPVVKKETTLSKEELLANFDWDKAAQNDMYSNEERTGLRKRICCYSS
jgi:hypothetical protein